MNTEAEKRLARRTVRDGIGGVMESARQSVLLIEDDPGIQFSLRGELEEAGYRVHTAKNGAEAFQVLAEMPLPDVILLDLLLPVMDGWQFLRARGEQGPLARVPVVVLSAVSYRGAPGAAAVLPKPINMPALLKVMRQHAPLRRAS